MTARLTLCRGDGAGKLGHLAPLVRELQAAVGAEPDGVFGRDTEKAVQLFRKLWRLEPSGAADADVWRMTDEPLFRFRGWLEWVHAQEGHQGELYCPGGASGVTMDPGIDLGHAGGDVIEAALAHYHASDADREIIETARGLRGPRAEAWLADGPPPWRFSRDDAARLFPRVAKDYWEPIRERFPGLNHPECLPSVQTAMLSLAINRGARNRHLEPLGGMSASGMAEKIGKMQQRHRLKAIRRRRKEEAALIRRELSSG